MSGWAIWERANEPKSFSEFLLEISCSRTILVESAVHSLECIGVAMIVNDFVVAVTVVLVIATRTCHSRLVI